MPTSLQPGLKRNWKQFALLVIINAFVGGMIGLERTIFPQFAESAFGVSSYTAMLSFITAFGISKAIANYYTGRWANAIGRKKLLIIGWVIALPVPVLFIVASNWNYIILANILLGVSQGLTWSSTVVMKMDLVGDKHRGLAMGLNEFAGYAAVGLMAYVTGWIAEKYGVTPYPFYVGMGVALTGLLLSVLFVKDTHVFIPKTTADLKTSNVFMDTTLKNKTLSAITQAGLVNNLNDGMMWGLLPVLLSSMFFDTQQIGVVVAMYPMVWGMGQIATGTMADYFSKKNMLVLGMALQGVVIVAWPFLNGYATFIALAALLGMGTALVYPTFLATIAHEVPAIHRAETIGVFRLWRDLGYAVGAILSGIIADMLGIEAAIILTGVLTLISAAIIQIRMPN